jgi:hypothetical protein
VSGPSVEVEGLEKRYPKAWVCVAALLFSLTVFAAIGIWRFIRRAID